MKNLSEQTYDELIASAKRMGYKHMEALHSLDKRGIILLLRGKSKAVAQYNDWKWKN